MSKQSVMIEIGGGELIDKITILQIKSARIKDAQKLKNVLRELDILTGARDASLPASAALTALTDEIKSVNESLWDIEDEIRACEARKDFGARFIALARAVYQTNDRRAEIKKRINLLTGAGVIEEKSYTSYGPPEK